MLVLNTKQICGSTDCKKKSTRFYGLAGVIFPNGTQHIDGYYLCDKHGDKFTEETGVSLSGKISDCDSEDDRFDYGTPDIK